MEVRGHFDSVRRWRIALSDRDALSYCSDFRQKVPDVIPALVAGIQPATRGDAR
jgi:hypothetical protein